MKIIDAGHMYVLDSLDGGEPVRVTFVKRQGAKFPFNSGVHGGTNVQEVLRALIDRTKYLLSQEACAETEAALGNLQSALLHYEVRAARRHDRHLDLYSVDQLSNLPTCETCRHIGCDGKHENLPVEKKKE